MEHTAIKILFAAGGTGGHLFPALAIAEELRRVRPNTEIIFVGTKHKIEARVVPQHAYDFRTIWISGFHRMFRLSNFLFPIKVIVALMQSINLVRMIKPDVVIGTGGYVAGPVLYAASMLGVPTIIHESNSYPGVTTRLLSKRADRVFLTFESTREYLKRKDNVEVVGNPTRANLENVTREEGARFFDLDPMKKTLLVFGGSLGAASINRAVRGALKNLTDGGIQVIWQTGDLAAAVEVSTTKPATVWTGKFIDRIDCAYAAADLVLCRAGATALAELTRLGKPAILVPYPQASEGHQQVNAEAMVHSGAAEIILDHELMQRAQNAILRLMGDDSTRAQMSEASRQLGRPDAAHIIVDKLLNSIRTQRN